MLNCLFVKTQKCSQLGAVHLQCESDSKDIAAMVVGYAPAADVGVFRYGLFLMRFI